MNVFWTYFCSTEPAGCIWRLLKTLFKFFFYWIILVIIFLSCLKRNSMSSIFHVSKEICSFITNHRTDLSSPNSSRMFCSIMKYFFSDCRLNWNWPLNHVSCCQFFVLFFFQNARQAIIFFVIVWCCFLFRLSLRK